MVRTCWCDGRNGRIDNVIIQFEELLRGRNALRRRGSLHFMDDRLVSPQMWARRSKIEVAIGLYFPVLLICRDVYADADRLLVEAR